MTYGETGTTRGSGLVKWATRALEAIGLLNKGSADASAVPGTNADGVTPVASNALNVTRVGGVAAFIAGAGGAALALFNVDKADGAAIVAAAYGAVGLIVAAALLTAALIIVADIRARASIAVATAEPQHEHPTVKTVKASVDGTWRSMARMTSSASTRRRPT